MADEKAAKPSRSYLGVVLPQVEILSPEVTAISTFARETERSGFDHLLAFDHVLGVDSTSRPGWDGYYDHTAPFLEPITLFAFLGSVTAMEFLTDILILPQRQTALVAKQAATLDLLVEGRMRLGVGIGWNEVEYEALGETFSTRVRRFEEQIGLLRKLWTQPVVDHTGEFDRIDRAGIAPLPVQRPIPIWIGCGDNDVALERVGRLADGWIPHPGLGDGPRFKAAWAKTRQSAEFAGRDPDALGLQGHVPLRDTAVADTDSKLIHWIEMGASHVAFNPLGAGLEWPIEHLDVCVQVGARWSQLVDAR